jgi:dimethylargininase
MSGIVTSNIALVRRPSPRLAEGIVTHQARVPIDLDLARAQWDGYVAALSAAGWDCLEVPPVEACPDSVFVEDTVVVYEDLAVMARPGAESRRAETAAVAEVLAELGYAVVHIDEPGTLDGGDVLTVGDLCYVGRGGRTNAEGVRQLRKHLAPRGGRVAAVRLARVLHLKSAVTALPDGSIIGWEAGLEDPSYFPRFISMPEESGSHVVLVGGGKLVMAADCPASTAVLADLGYQPVNVDISEFEKLEGCVTCLSVLLPAAASPN